MAANLQTGERGNGEREVVGRGAAERKTLAAALVNGAWNDDERRWIRLFREELEKQYKDDVKKALLFGSKARGDGKEYSDVDILVIVRSERDGVKTGISKMAVDVMYEHGCWEVLPSVFVLTEQEWKEGLRNGKGIHCNIEEEGVVVL